MAQATFVLKEPKSKKNTLIYLIYRFNNNRFKYSTGLSIHPNNWNEKNQRTRETKDFTKAAEYNTTLKDLSNDIDTIYRRLVNDKIKPTTDILRVELDKLSIEGESTLKNDFIHFIEGYIQTTNKRPNTIKHYNQALRVLKEFQSETNRKLTFEDIDLEFYDEFLKYCLAKNYGANTIGGYQKNIKVFMNEAFDRKLTTNIEYKNRRFRTIEEDTENIYLDKKEIDALFNLDLKNNTRLDNVRDIFIIGCYTGLRYSDLLQLNNSNIIDSGNKIRIKTEKTGETVIIPLHKYIKSILKKHSGIPDYKISNQKMNEYLKELGELAEFDEKVLISTTRGGKKVSESFEKFKLITVHTARRSFATNAYLMDIPSISIMKITGHRTEKAFLKYIKISQEDNANKLLNHPFFK